MMPKFFSHNCPRINVRYVGNHFHRTEFFGLGGFSAESNTTPDPATFPLWLQDLVLPFVAQAASITYVKSPIPIHS